jgi:hypothetical protein
MIANNRHRHRLIVSMRSLLKADRDRRPGISWPAFRIARHRVSGAANVAELVCAHAPAEWEL